MSKRDDLPSDNPDDDRNKLKMTEADLTPAPAAPFERWLDGKLKSVYGSVLEEPIPQDLINLLREKLDKAN